MRTKAKALTTRRRTCPRTRRVSQADFEQLLLEISHDFVRAVAPDIDALIQRWLARLGAYLGLGALTLYQPLGEPAALRCTHQWKRGVRRQTQLRGDFPTAVSPCLQAGEIHALNDRRRPHPSLRCSTGAQAGSSGVAISLAVTGQPIGVLAVHGTGRPRTWPRQLVRRLQILGEVFTHALERRREWAESQRLLAQSAHAARIAMLGELTTSLADEFRQPLAAALSDASAIKRLLSGPQAELTKARAALDDIMESGNRLAQATRLVRTLARNCALERSPTDPADAIEGAVRLLSADAAFRGITLVTDLRPGMPAILVHKVQFQQVIIDVVVNAFEMVSEVAPDSRRVLITGGVRAGRELVVSVVADNVLPRDSRLHAYNAKPPLFISNLIVETYRGALRVKHAAPADAVFEISIPLTQN